MTIPFRPIGLDAFTDEVKSIYALSEREAHWAGHPLIESDHLVLGAVAERNSLAAATLAKFGLDFGRLPELREQLAELVPNRVCFDGHDIDDTRPSLETLQLLQLGRLLMVRENPAAADRRLASPLHLLQAILLRETNNPQMQRLLYSQGHSGRKVRPGVKLLEQNGVDIAALRTAIATEPHSWF